MTHPANMHAAANCWSLRRSWSALRDANTLTDGDAGTLRSAAASSTRHASGHADTLADAVITQISRGSHYANTVDTIRDDVDQARWLATSALRQQGMPLGPALAALTRVIGDLDPATAAEVGRYLDHADQAARRYLRIDTDHLPLPGNPKCPVCGVRMLRARRSNPDSSAWPVICAAGCVCTGNTCPCGMTVRQKQAVHIWPAGWAVATLNLDSPETGA